MSEGYIEQAARVTDGVSHHSAEFAVGLSLAFVAGAIIFTYGTGGLGGAVLAAAGAAGNGFGLGQLIDRRRARDIEERIEKGAETVVMDEGLLNAAIAHRVTTLDGHRSHWVREGSSVVFIELFNASRYGDNTTCDGLVVEGSPTIFIGGEQVYSPMSPNDPNEVIGFEALAMYEFALTTVGIAGGVASWRNMSMYERAVFATGLANTAGLAPPGTSTALLAEGTATRGVTWGNALMNMMGM